MVATPFLGAEDAAPGVGAAAVTPANGSDLARQFARALYVGATGDLAVVMIDGTTASFVGVPAGTMLPIRVSRVLSTGTTATSIVAIY